ncbi:Uncharacterized protein BP5553_03756 [Venustampulla echinocandica]|uniref:ADF-H domain-containing protein n=1 Tax=Venustampulla echinocandica TaxID=2656787 RepID=A0A370TV67_9HELO|nr:Uncharacterized protein BP5553_03756 [Venustampulla echinocandica]RDL39416.1 Uncharacterized protein BP5553_03756 [Venustampulla echinocandica]
MSLNGLDDVKLKEAHDAAVAEPGGWFLLKYILRDEVGLLGRGNGGIVEIRNTIATYEEPSPLFGFLRYRRRNVLIKYIPEDCSRLVQARVTVHFNAVTERFSPHDTVFPISNSKELRDTSLSAACSLHTASGSTSSSTSSLRGRRLMEIAEDEEEDTRKRQSTVLEERPVTAKAPSVSGVQISSPPEPPTNSLPTSTSFSAKIAELETSPPPPREPHDSRARSRSPTKHTDEPEPRKSSQSTRPNLYTYNSHSSMGRPKVKLGPRPSLDVSGRPHTSGATSHYRPVSTLPVGLKIFSKGSRKGTGRPQSQYNVEPPSMTISPPPVPDSMLPSFATAPSRPHTSGGRPPPSPTASIRPLIGTNLNAAKTSSITPEKARLMKALELRKKQMSAPHPVEPLSPSPSTNLDAPRAEPNRLSRTPKDVNDSLTVLDDMLRGDDSGISFGHSSTLKTDESDATRSDSYPASPVGPSEHAESTKASSISESTDQTVQDADNSKPPPQVAEPELDDNISNNVDNQEPVSLHEKGVEIGDVESDFQLPQTTYEPESQTTPTQDSTSKSSSEPSELALEEPYKKDDEPIATATDHPLATFHVPVPQVAEAQVAEIPQVAEAQVAENPQVAEAPVEVSTTEEIPTEEIPVTVQESETTAIPVPVAPTKSPAKPEPKELKIPRSKFSMQNLQSDEGTPSIPTQPTPQPTLLSTFHTPQKSPIVSTISVDVREPTAEDDQANADQITNKRQNRRGLIEPIRTDLELTDRSNRNSDANFSSDEDLMDELQSAVVEEAKPVSVSKTPMTPLSPTVKKADTWRHRLSRAASNPLRKEEPESQLLTPPAKHETVRSASASSAYLNRINQEAAKPIAKKVNLGSGISQRIKALEKLSSTAPGATAAPTAASPAAGATSFFSVRKSSIRRPSKSSSIAERTNSLTKNTPSPSISRESSPETVKVRDRSSSIKNRVSAFEPSPVPFDRPSRSRPESISVTARIIRDPAQPFQTQPEVGKDPFEYAPLDLKQSPLVINHQKAVVKPAKETIQERRLSKEKRLSTSSEATNTTPKGRRSSITVVKDLINDTRSSFAERRRSINFDPSASSTNLRTPSRPPSVKSPSRPPSTHASPIHQRSMSISSRLSSSSHDQNIVSPAPLTSDYASSIGEEKSDKKSNRASRMLRRMSSSLSSGRKAISHAVSPTVREESEPPNNGFPTSMSPHPSTPPTPNINIGDVNVQFPDSLLWKRRSMLLDPRGSLLLAPLTTSGNAKNQTGGATRRFHLSEFRPPVIPDVEMQELPNSVVLDFFEGGGLQVACEDRAGQGRIFQALQEAHRTWSAHG